MAAAAAMCCSHRAMARGSGLLPLRLRLPGGGGAAQRAGSQPAAAAACGRESGTGGTWRRTAAATHRRRGARTRAPGEGGGSAASAPPARCPPPSRPPRCPALPCGTGAAGPAQPAHRGRCITQACAGGLAEAGGGKGEGARGEWRREARVGAGAGGSPGRPGPVGPGPRGAAGASPPVTARLLGASAAAGRAAPRVPGRRRSPQLRCRQRPGRGSAAVAIASPSRGSSASRAPVACGSEVFGPDGALASSGRAGVYSGNASGTVPPEPGGCRASGHATLGLGPPGRLGKLAAPARPADMAATCK